MIYLEVPFREKDHAKSLGARWDAVSKKWYIPEDFAGNLDDFRRWLPAAKNVETATTNLDLNTLSSPRSLALNANCEQPTLELPQPDSQAEETKGKRLSEVLFSVENVLRQGFPGGLWVIAEIANLNARRGHVYLELTETDEHGQTMANCRAMIWKSQAENLLQRFHEETGSELQVGQKVLFLAEVSFHSQYGFSLVIRDLDTSYTLGELEQRLKQIRQALIKKGIYLENKKHTLPDDFFRIAVIAPPEAAGLGDFRADADHLQANGLCEFKYFYSSFQGIAVEAEFFICIGCRGILTP